MRQALALWRGPPLADVAYEAFAQAEVRRLEELRLVAIEARIAADLELGHHAALVPELEQLVAFEPTREGLAAQLMLALYRCGRQADALDAYRRIRAHLTEELGLEPGPALSALQSQILVHEHDLDLGIPAVRIPSRPAHLIGRDADVAAVLDLVSRARLVTITGVGGVGKTSLALEIAHRVQAIGFAELAPLAGPEGVPDAIVQAIGGAVDPAASPRETLLRLIPSRDGLLVLDNFEHVNASAPLVAELLEAAPRLTLLVTSRAALALRGEQRYPLEPLSLDAAADLFVERARARNAGFQSTETDVAAIAEVCRRVAALPLAIELAAARTSVLSPGEIAARLEDGLGSGPVDAPQRQQTMRATLDWSHRLLDDDEAEAFARVSVFAGGCTVAAAEEVTGASLDTLDGLVAKSMVVRRVGADGSSRLALLEPVREYAAGRLVDRNDTERRHADHYLRLAREIEPELRAGAQVEAVRRIDVEAANIRAALSWARAAGDAAGVLDAAVALEEWWFERGLWTEAIGWLEWGLENGAHVEPVLRGDALTAVSYMLWPVDDVERRIAALDRARELFEQAGDIEGVAWTYTARATLLWEAGDPGAVGAAEEAVRLATGHDDHVYGSALRALAVSTDDAEQSRLAAERSARHLERAGDLRTLSRLWEEVAYAAAARGDIDGARELVERAMAIITQRGDWNELATARVLRGIIALEMGDNAAALVLLREAMRRYRALGIRTGLPQILRALAVVAARGGEAATAGQLAGASRALEPPNSRPDPLDVRLEAAARESCPRDVWEREVAAGAALPADVAIELGLRPWGETPAPDAVHDGVAWVRTEV